MPGIRGFLHSQLFVTPKIPASTSFNGQTIIVTGSNSGLGKEAARHFAALGAAKVIIAVRNLKSGEEARQDIIRTTQCSAAAIEVWELDLSSYASVKSFADRASKLPRLDVLLENAGISTRDYKFAEGHESTITVNVISLFLLALLMLPKLKAQVNEHGITPRISIVSSEVHQWTKFAEQNVDNIFAKLDDKATANMTERYMTSKLLEVLVIRHLAPKLADSGVVLNYINPGLCRSGLMKDEGIIQYIIPIMMAIFARSTESGSRNLVVAASLGQESHGKYVSDTKIDEAALSPFVKSPDGARLAEKVWTQLKPILETASPGVSQGL